MNARRTLAASGLVFGVAVLANSWTLKLPFQLDDYVLLEDPLSLFARARAAAPGHSGGFGDGAVPASMLRWPLWALWSLLAALGGELRCPLLFHAVGLATHALVAALLMRVTARLIGGQRGARAGLLAGLGFGLCAGHAQAFSWSAAWADLLTALFALLSLDLMLSARLRRGRAASWRRVLAGLAVLLALLSKTPALVFIPALAVLLMASDRRGATEEDPASGSALRAIPVELALLGAALLLTLASRWLYLGELTPRYGGLEVPDLRQVPGALAGGAATALQALLPWVRHPLVEDQAPLMLGWLGSAKPWTPALLAGLLALCPMTLAACLGGRARKSLLVVLLVGALLCLPAGLIASAPLLDNSLGRLAYWPCLALFPGLGLGLARLFEHSRARAAALLLATLLLGLLLGGRAHVVGIEHLQSLHQDAALQTIEELAVETPEGELVLLQIAPDFGYAGVPGLGHFAGRALAPPFRNGRPVEVLARAHRSEFERLLATRDLTATSMAVLGPDSGWQSAQLNGSERPHAPELRALYQPRLLEGPYPGLPVSSLASIAWEREPLADGERWTPELPVPAHALGALGLASPGIEEVRGTLLLEGPGGVPLHSLELRWGTEGAPRSLVFDPLQAGARPGPELQALVWRSAARLSPPEALPELPQASLRLMDTGAPLLLAPRSAPPLLAVDIPAPDGSAAWVRVELLLQMPHGPLAIWGDARLRGSPPWEFSLDSMHLGGIPVPAPSGSTYPWRSFFELADEQGILERRALTTQLLLTATVHRIDGLTLARSHPLPLAFRAPADAQQ